MMTGSFGGTYAEIGADLASALDDGHNFRLLPVVGRGSVQAVADMLFLKGVDVGIVRTDTLDYLEKKGYSSNIKEQFAYITKLYNEEMHVVAAKAIRNIKDLDGKTVAVDLPDGGTFVTAISVFERLGYNWSPSTDRYRRLPLLVDALFSKIKRLQHTPFHPKWKEVTLHATLPGWTRFKPAHEWIDRNAAPVPATASITTGDNTGRFAAMDGTDELRSAFYEFLSQRQRSGGEQPDNLDGLFRDFLQWQASSHASHRCLCRISNPNVPMVKPTQDWQSEHPSHPLGGAESDAASLQRAGSLCLRVG